MYGFGIPRWLLGLTAITAGCASGVTTPPPTDNVVHSDPMAIADFTKLDDNQQVRYFADQIYLAATMDTGANAHREAAQAALEHLQSRLKPHAFVAFWSNVDNRFFGHVNAPFQFDTSARTPLSPEAAELPYAYDARHLTVLDNLADVRHRAMDQLLTLASRGDATACLAFRTAYRHSDAPRAGAQDVTWLDVDGLPHAELMTHGSAQARLADGQVRQIPLPAQVVFGCRDIDADDTTLNTGVLANTEAYFKAIDPTAPGFNVSAFRERQSDWRQDLQKRAEDVAQRTDTSAVPMPNVVDIYRLLPRNSDHHLEQAARHDQLAEMAGAGLIKEQEAFELNQRVKERKILRQAGNATPEETPLAFLYLVSDRRARAPR